MQGGNTHRWYKIDPREYGVVGRWERPGLERRGKEDCAVQLDPRRVRQRAHEPGDAVPVAATPHNEHRRAPPPVRGEPPTDELEYRVEITRPPRAMSPSTRLMDGPPLIEIVVRCIDEHKIG